MDSESPPRSDALSGLEHTRPEGRPPLLATRAVSKSYPGVQAVAEVDFEVGPGEVVGLIGENGAGKSTLVRMLSGLETPDAGSILVDGTYHAFSGPADARGSGVGTVFQQASLVPSLTGLENLLLTDPAVGRIGRLDRKASTKRYAELLAHNDLAIDLDIPVSKLAVGEQQRLEILKCIRDEPRVLILDEPTAVLNIAEVAALMRLVEMWADEGRGVVLISHKLEELLAVTQQIVVLRKGRVVERWPTAETTPEALARAMVGRLDEEATRVLNVEEFAADGFEVAPEQLPPVATVAGALTDVEGPTPDDVVLALRGVSVGSRGGAERLDAVDLEIGRGSILCVAGIEGNGQRCLVDVVTGTERPSDGTVTLDDRDVSTEGVRARLDAGLAVVNEDRANVSGIESMTVLENLALRLIDEPGATRLGFAKWRAIRRHARQLAQAYGVTAPLHAQFGTLSGGNQQRVILARELGSEPIVLVADQPTQGLDVHGVAYVRSRIAALRDSGCGVLLVSSELEEILELADEVAVIQRGRFVGRIPRARLTREGVARMMVGEAA